jgi:putative ABC transport system substrate-binding protein
MRRREFVTGLLLAATIGRAQAQQPPKVYRIAVVHASFPITDISESANDPIYRAFFQELRRLGYIEGQNLMVERYSGEGRFERYPELARDVARTTPDLIFTSGNEMVLNFKAATATIPIVCVTADPVAYGFVKSLARPGGNITGISTDAGLEIWGKRIEILQEAIPKLSKAGFLVSRAQWDGPIATAVRKATERFGISLTGPPLEGDLGEAEYRRVFAAMAEQRVDALIVHPQPEHVPHRGLIVALAESTRLPTMYPRRVEVDLGGLMAYAYDIVDLFRRAAGYVDEVLKGARPGDIPIYQAAHFQLVINVRAAKAIGLTIPPSLLLRADEVIE